jgi:DNA-binding MarR family transcriptional regulator
MGFKEKVTKLNQYFFQLFMDRNLTEKRTCSNSPLSQLTYNDLRTFELIEAKGTANMRVLADQLHLPMSTLTGITDKLVKKDFINRMRNDDDRRVVQVNLTELGKEMILLSKSAHTSVSEGILNALSDREQDEFLRLLKKVIGGHVEKQH